MVQGSTNHTNMARVGGLPVAMLGLGCGRGSVQVCVCRGGDNWLANAWNVPRGRG